MNDETVDITTDDREYSLDELSTLADVSPRTVRYYIVEGLLPPPLTTGRNATYSQEHLDRLNAIASMKEMFLPLREIRHRLNTLTPEQMRDPAYLATLSQAVAMERAVGKRHGRRDMAERFGAESARHAMHPDMHRGRPEHPGRRRGRPETSPMLSSEPEASEATSQTWERFPLGDDAELLIRSSRAKNMGPRLYRTLHKLRHMIETDQSDDERGRR